MAYLLPLVALIGSALTTAGARAQTKFPHMPTPVEIAAMPEYCQAKMGANKALHDHWRLRIGPDLFVHLHHYCHGLKEMSRSRMTIDKQQRRYLLQNAVREFEYVIRNWPADFALTEDAVRGKKQAQSLLGLL